MVETRNHSAAGENGRRRGGRQRAGMVDRLKRWLSGAPTPSDGDAPAPSASEVEVDLVDQAAAFQSLRVADVMTPRVDVAALEISTPLAEVLRRFIEGEHSRMPIFRETLDDPVGVVHLKDLIKLIEPPKDDGLTAAEPPWRDQVLHRLRRDLLYVPASMRTADLLLRMRVQRTHMALVIDEFGGCDGLVTLEDLVEAVVGEIDDEHDDATAPAVVTRPGGLYEADARVPLEELEALLGLPLSLEDQEEEIDTVAGLVATLAGRVPQRGEVIVHSSGVEFEVIDADPRRIRRLRIRPPTRSSGVAADGDAAPKAS
jgi:CBS domain containing-hemolysin-like protein